MNKEKNWMALDAILQHDEISSKVIYYYLVGINNDLEGGLDPSSELEVMDDLIYTCYINDISRVYVYDFGVFASYLNHTLLKNGFKSNNNIGLKPKEFSEFSLNGNTYSIKICCRYTEGTRVLEFLSALNVLRTPIEKLNKSYCNCAYNYSTTMLQITDDSYLKQNDIERCQGTAKILAESLSQLKSEVGLCGSTIGKIAFKTWMQTINRETFEECFPKISDAAYNATMAAYRGGYTYLNDKYRNQEIKRGASYDVNSLFMYMMRYKAMPIGEPLYIDDPQLDEDHIDDYGLYHVVMEGGLDDSPCAIIKDGKLPCISCMSNNIFEMGTFVKNEYAQEIINFDGWLTGVDLKMFLERYDLFYDEIDIPEMFLYQKTNGLFSEFIDKCYFMKKNSTEGKKEVWKMLGNNLHGKFGTKKGGTLDFSDIQNDKVVRKHKENTNKDIFSYPAISVWANAFARKKIIEDAEKNIDRLVYIDTDSMHLLGTEIPDNITISDEIGDYKIEDTWLRAKYIKMKTYIHEHEDTSLEIKMCGATPAVKENIKSFESFNVGERFPGLTGIKQLDGGKIRVPLEYSLSASKLKVR